MKWYKNEQLLNYAKKADEALDKRIQIHYMKLVRNWKNYQPIMLNLR